MQQDVALSGHVVEDLTFAPFRPGAFRAELLSVGRSPIYKPDGFFVFTNIRTGQYRLRLSAERCNPEENAVSIPHGPVTFESPPELDTLHAFERPGDNELVVIVDAINAATSRVFFVPEILPLGIPPGAPVRSTGFAAHLNEPLDVGLVSSVRLDTTAGLSLGAVLRIIRGRSVRMRFNPYDALPSPATRLVGRVALDADPSVPLAGAEVRLLEVNGSPVNVIDVEGAPIATIAPVGTTAVLGTESDIATRTNGQGDYTLYAVRSLLWTSVMVRVRLAGFIDAVVTALLLTAARNRIDVQLIAV